MDSASPPEPTPIDSDLSRRAILALAAGLGALVLLELALVWSHPWLPTNDGPAHQYSAWVAQRLRNDPGTTLAETFRLNLRGIYPNALYSWFLEALAGRVPMPVAEKLGVSIYLGLLPLAMIYFCRSLGREPWLPAYLAAALSFNLLFFLGFFNFLWSLPLVFVVLGAVQGVIDAPRPTLRRLLIVNLLVALTFCAHLMGFGLALAGAFVLVLAARRGPAWRALAAFLPAAALTPLAWPRSVGWRADWVWHAGPVQRALDGALLNVASAFGEKERYATVAVGVPVAIAAVYGLARPGPGRRPLAALTASVFLAMTLVPTRLGAGGRLDQRLMLFLWLLLAAAVRPARRYTRALAALAISSVLVAHVVFLDGRFGAFDAQMRRYLSALPRMEPGSLFCSFEELPRPGPFEIAPLVTAHVHYAMALGGPDYDLYQAAPRDADHFPVAYTELGASRWRELNRKSWLPASRIARWADYVLVWGRPEEEVRRLIASGRYRPEWEDGPLRLFGRGPARRAPGGAARSRR